MITKSNNIKRENIKVLQIITVFSVGGATEHVVLCSAGLAKLGYQVDVVTGLNIASEGSMFEEAKQANLNVRIIPTLKKNINIYYDLKASIELFKILRNGKYDIVQTHSSKAGILGRIVAKIAGVPIIIHTVHGLPFHEYQSKIINYLYGFLEKFGAKFCDHLMAVTHTIVRKSLVKKIGNENKYSVIRSSLDMDYLLNLKVDKTKMRERLGIKPDDKVIGKISRFSKLKGYNYLFDAIPEVVKQVPNVKFLLIGGGELEDHFKKLAIKMGLEENVVFAGLVEHEKVPQYISIMDIVVHTSLLEGLARIMPQSFVLEKPIVSFDIDGAHEIIEHGKSGLLVPPLNKSKLIEHLLDLLNDNEKAIRFGKHGKQRVLKEWNKEYMIEQMDEVYLSLYKKSIKKID